jgi:SpoVK/Ycf46/Vps4 family AAA+-type ATPase
MAASPKELKTLRDALQLSPDNVPLRQHYADELLSHGRAEEAEKEYREALAHDRDNAPLKTGLAHAFYQQGKYDEALVLIEDLLKSRDTPARAYLLHARLLLRSGDTDRAAKHYNLAIEADSSVADAELAERLGLGDDAGGDDKEKRKTVDDDQTIEAGSDLERPTVTFKDVGGMESVKEEICMKIIYPMTHPELYQAYGKAMGGGILMYGPPGCGKTQLARATAGEVRAAFMAVEINEVLNMYVGQSERNLHAIFEQARAHKPCVLFFDEVDALAASRTKIYSSGHQLINQFLAELDGVGASNEGVLVLAATNAPWHLDTAFRRPGRFDRILFVPPPDAEARAAILRLLCRGKPIETIDYDHLAKKTDGFSGADLKALVDVAVEKKLREAMKVGVPKPLTNKDLVEAAGAIRPSTKEWLATARNYALYSNQGGVYDEILKFLKLGS